MKYRSFFAPGLLALAVSGCAVAPDPLQHAASVERARTDLVSMFEQQEPIKGPLTLHEAMARAVKYNLEARAKLMEEALAMRQLSLVNFDMLPRIAAEAGYEGRSNRSASRSQSIKTNRQSLESSTSQDRDREVADLTMVWNVLDFGVSYVSAQQQADQKLIIEERRRKVIQTIIQDVRSAYWRAVAAERLLGKIDGLMDRVLAAQADSERLSSQLLGDPVQALNYQRSLIEALRQLDRQRKSLALAKTELAALINLPMDSEFTLVADEQYAVPDLPVTLDTLEEQALSSRPELREQDYQARISAAETRKAMLRMLPGLEFSMGGHYDSNSYLEHQSWADYGVKVTWNLFNVLSGPAAVEAAQAGEDLSTARRQAMSMAVLAQVHVALANLGESRRQFETSQKLVGLDGQILTQLRNRHLAQALGDLELIQGELRALQAELERDLTYADLRNAYGQVFASAGYDPLPDELPADDLQTLTAALSETEAHWFAP